MSELRQSRPDRLSNHSGAEDPNTHGLVSDESLEPWRESALSHCAANHGVCGRNCDRAVEWSPSLEAFDERRGLFLVHAGEDEV